MSLAFVGDSELELSEGEELELEPFSFTWVINSWDTMRKSKKLETTFSQEADGRKFSWRCDLHPAGTSMIKKEVAMHFGASETVRFQKGWFREVRVEATLVNKEDEALSVTVNAQGRVSEKDRLGWDSLCSKDVLKRPGFVVGNKLEMRLTVQLLKEKGCSASYQAGYRHDSKQATGFCGIKNQGATCYLNSLLQALYLIAPFRHGVYQMPTENDEPKKSVGLALQRLFYRLQHGKSSASTKELTASFGWDAADVFQQQDVQELNRVLQDKIEEKMKGTAADGVVPGLFRGKMVSYIKCLDIEYESKREEDFYDISLDVDGCKNVVESFERYTLAERLDGENQYQAEGHGLQDAEKGIKFLKFPPVLHLQLKRFAFDFETLRNYKVNSRYEFDTELELKNFLDPKSEHPNSDCTTYVLQGVFIHSGSLGGGHYYAFFRPNTKPQWFKFNDSTVTRVTPEFVEENSFGGKAKRTVTDFWKKETTTEVPRSNSAYMLQYVRKDYLAEALGDVKDIPPHILQRFEEEENERARRKKVKAEAHLYLHVKVFTESDLRMHDMVDLIDFDRFEPQQNFRVKRALTFPEFQKDHVATVFNVPPERQRFFLFTRRKNKTIRASNPLKLNDGRTIDVIFQRYKRNDIDELRLLLDVSERKEPPFFDPIPKDKKQLFFKFYNPDTRQLRYFHRAFIPYEEPIGSYAPDLLKQLGLAPNTALLWFEELQFKNPARMDAIDISKTLKALELGNGDIIVVQVKDNETLRASTTLRAQLTQSGNIVPADEQEFPSAKEYFQYLCARVSVTFKRLEDYREDKGIRLLMVKTNTYTEVQALLAQHLEGVDDPSRIRFTRHTQTGERPHWTGPTNDTTTKLSKLIESGWNTIDNDILYYEVLPCSIEDMLSKLVVPINVRDPKQELFWEGKLIVDRECTVKTLTVELAKELGEPKKELRCYTTYFSKVSKVLEGDDLVRSLVGRGKADLLFEIVNDEEAQELADGAQLTPVSHVEKTYSVRAHDTPFLMAIKDGTTFQELREKICSRLGERYAKFPLLMCKGNYGGSTELEEGDKVDLSIIADKGYIGIMHPRVSSSRYKSEGVKIN